MSGVGLLGLVACAIAGLGACDDPETEACSAAAVLDPSDVHYGQTYAGWAGLWTEWYYETSSSDCDQYPTIDPTGAFCSQGNDNPDVFFLAGNFGGVTSRGSCTVPAGKALFFPIINLFVDNAGVVMPLSDEENQAIAEAFIDNIEVDKLVLEVDGCAAQGLVEFAVVAAPYTATIPPEPNLGTCVGVPGVMGTYPGFVTGYWAMLPPLEPGPHRIRFAGSSRAGDSVFELDVTFDPLVVE